MGSIAELYRLIYRIIFGWQVIRGSAIKLLRHFVSNIFVVRACTAGKGRLFRGAKRSWSDLQRRIFCPTKITLYTVFENAPILCVNFEPHPVTGCLCAEKQRRQWESKASRQPKLDLYHTYNIIILYIQFTFYSSFYNICHWNRKDPSPPHLCLAHILLPWSNKVKAS